MLAEREAGSLGSMGGAEGSAVSAAHRTLSACFCQTCWLVIRHNWAQV